MLRATHEGRILTETPRTVRVDSSTRTLCPWKGYGVLTDRTSLQDTAWYYPKPTPLARRIGNHVAFGPEVHIDGEPEGPPTGLLATVRARLVGRR